jgi:transcriptional regulator with XRE-family HTH domain
MTPEQSRAARGWLGWSQTELAKRANVSLSTVRDFETRQRTPISNNIAAMRRAIETAGIRLLFDDSGNGAGVVLQNIGNPRASLRFDQTGDRAGILRPGHEHI